MEPECFPEELRSIREVSIDLKNLDPADPEVDLGRLQYLWAEFEILVEVNKIKEGFGFPPPTFH